jgi:hypothetical protein
VVGHLQIHHEQRERQKDQGHPEPVHRQNHHIPFAPLSGNTTLVQRRSKTVLSPILYHAMVSEDFFDDGVSQEVTLRSSSFGDVELSGGSSFSG